MTGKMSGTEKDAYRIPKFNGKRKDYYRWSRLFLSYADLRKYQDILTGETPIPDIQDAAVKSENDPQVKDKPTDVLARSRKAKSEVLTAVEKSSRCFFFG